MTKKKSSNLTLGEAEKTQGLELVAHTGRSSLTNVIEYLISEAHSKLSPAQVKAAKAKLKKSDMHAHKAQRA